MDHRFEIYNKLSSDLDNEEKSKLLLSSLYAGAIDLDREHCINLINRSDNKLELIIYVLYKLYNNKTTTQPKKLLLNILNKTKEILSVLFNIGSDCPMLFVELMTEKQKKEVFQNPGIIFTCATKLFNINKLFIDWMIEEFDNVIGFTHTNAYYLEFIKNLVEKTNPNKETLELLALNASYLNIDVLKYLSEKINLRFNNDRIYKSCLIWGNKETIKFMEQYKILEDLD